MRWRPRRHEPLTIELDFSTPADDVDFAHESERQFARLLDFYGIEWHYEPRSFPIEFDEDGEPAKYFTPDFYLAADDLFIEITTMSQKLVTKKNRKIRLLREHHPDVRCKIFRQGRAGTGANAYPRPSPDRQPGRGRASGLISPACH